MGTNKIIAYIRTIYRSGCHHPFVLGMVFFLVIMYGYFPTMFGYLVSCTPVIVCTTLLLGIVLVYGEPNIPEIEQEDNKIQQISMWKANDLVVQKDDNMGKTRTGLKERKVKEAGKGKTSVASMAGKHMLNARMHDERDENGGRFVQDKTEVLGEKKMAEIQDHDFVDKREFSVETQGEDVFGAKVETDKSVLGNGQPTYSHDESSDCESDEADNSSPDASVTDIIPMLDDELDPLLDSGAPQTAHVSMNNSEAASSRSSQDHESDEGSADEEDVNQEDEEDEEAPEEEKDDGNEAVVKWTADDQKNLMDLGTSELERNQRLENMIAKRRARKFLSFHIQKNLIDFDANDPVPNMEELSRFHHQIPSISAPRNNPFDLPCDPQENIGLPPIPGSAPSVLQPRRNPFDLPFDQVGGPSNLKRGNVITQEFVPVAQRDTFFRRHESFTLGKPLSSEDFKQEKHDPKLKPYFVADSSQDVAFGSLERQSSEKSESDSTSSVVDEDDKEPSEHEVHQESELLSADDLEAEKIERDSESSEENDSVDIVREHIEAGDDDTLDLNTSTGIEDAHQAAHAFGSNVEIHEEIEDVYDEAGLSSSEENEEGSRKSIIEESANLKQPKDGSSNGSSNSVQSVHADSDILNQPTDKVDDSQIEDPVYDSSPSASGNHHSNISALDEASLYKGKEDISSSTSLASDIGAGISELGSPSRSLEQTISSKEKNLISASGSNEENFAPGSGRLWVASTSLSSVDENESRSREIMEIREHDVINVGLSMIHEEFGQPISPILPVSAGRRMVHPSNLSFADTDLNEGSSKESHHANIEVIHAQSSEEVGLAFDKGTTVKIGSREG